MKLLMFEIVKRLERFSFLEKEEYLVNHRMAQYGKTSYWDERYTKDPEPFDWYQRYSGIRDLVCLLMIAVEFFV